MDADEARLYYRIIISVMIVFSKYRNHDARMCSFRKYERILIMST